MPAGMATNKADIKHVHWQLRLGEVEPEGGPVVAGYDDINQAILLIAMTPIGSVPSNPAKGCDLIPALDKPPAVAIPMICTAVWDAITLWEPRVETQTVSGKAIDVAHYEIDVPWRVKGDVAAQIQRTTIVIERPQNTVSAP